MSYDNWKTQPPEYYDYEDGDTCLYCGDDVKNGEKYCNDNCRVGYEND